LVSGTSAVGIRCRDQVQVPVSGDLEEVLFELRQVAGAAQRIGIDQERRFDLEVSVVTRVHVEHEVDQRAGQPRTGPHEHGEART
jgi:hypothetical protein